MVTASGEQSIRGHVGKVLPLELEKGSVVGLWHCSPAVKTPVESHLFLARFFFFLLSIISLPLPFRKKRFDIQKIDLPVYFPSNARHLCCCLPAGSPRLRHLSHSAHLQLIPMITTTNTLQYFSSVWRFTNFQLVFQLHRHQSMGFFGCHFFFLLFR